MPIRPFLDGHKFEPETQRLMGLAFEMARAAIHIECRGEPVDNKIIAEQIIEFAKTGEHDPDRLCEYAVAQVREALGKR
jgi:hypothetical protein